MFSFLQPRSNQARPPDTDKPGRQAHAPWWPGPELRVWRIEENHLGRDFVVGDLHGCLEPLGRLLAHVGFHQGRDRLFCVGDLVDRGPQSMDCLRLLEMPWFHCVLGNHEQMLIGHLEDPFGVDAYDEGWVVGQAQKFSERTRFAGKWLPKLKRLPLVMLVGRGDGMFGIVHGEVVERGTSVSRAMLQDWAFSNPERAMRAAVSGRKLVRAWRDGQRVASAHGPDFPTLYCGHTIVQAPVRIGGQVYIDTGAFVGHRAQRAPLHARATPQAGAQETALVGEPGLTLVLAGTHNAWFAPTQGRDIRSVLIGGEAGGMMGYNDPS